MIYPAAFVLIAQSDLPVEQPPPAPGSQGATRDPSSCGIPLTPPTSPEQPCSGMHPQPPNPQTDTWPSPSPRPCEQPPSGPQPDPPPHKLGYMPPLSTIPSLTPQTGTALFTPPASRVQVCTLLPPPPPTPLPETIRHMGVSLTVCLPLCLMPTLWSCRQIHLDRKQKVNEHRLDGSSGSMCQQPLLQDWQEVWLKQ